MSDLEIFTSLIAAIIHDFDHTGTTNNFHINSGSGLALLYNDRAVLENHHVSAFFRYIICNKNFPLKIRRVLIYGNKTQISIVLSSG